MISTVAGGIVLLGSVVSTVPQLEPLAPATREFVREQLAEATKAYANQYSQINTNLEKITAGILDSKIVALDGQIQVLTTQAADIDVKLHDAPGDPLLLGLRQTIKNSLSILEDQKSSAVCAKLQAQVPGSVC